MTVQDLVAMLGTDKGVNVAIDRKALAEVGIDPQTPVGLSGHGRMSLRNYARFVLRQANLVLQEEPYRLLITTPEEADNRLSTEVYPVADLMATDRLPDRGQLANPYLDHELAAEARIRAKLERPISVDFRGTPLRKVIDRVAGLLDDAVLVDERALNEVGLDTDVPVTAAWRDVPAKELLRWMLRDVGLTYVVENEALVITTPEEAENHLEPRLHSGRGVLYEYAVPAGGFPPGMAGRGGDGRHAGRHGHGRHGQGGMGGSFGGGGGMAGGMGGGMFGSAGGGMPGGMGGFGGPGPGFCRSFRLVHRRRRQRAPEQPEPEAAVSADRAHGGAICRRPRPERVLARGSPTAATVRLRLGQRVQHDKEHHPADPLG